MPEERILGLQSYAIRDLLVAADTPGTDAIIASVAAMGFRTMELRPEDYTPAPVEMKKILADHGMSICAMHTEMNALDNDYDDVVRRFRLMGCSQLVIPSRPRQETDIPRFIDKVAYYARRLKADDLRLQYHNHVAEFVHLEDGTTMMARLLSLAKGGLFAIEIDVGWVHVAGLDPVRFITELPTDVGIIHLRDVTAAPDFSNNAVTVRAGAGNLHWPSILDACRKRGVRHYIIEHNASNAALALVAAAAAKFLPLL